MFESCLRNYKERFGVLFFATSEPFTCARSQFFAERSGKAERESCLRKKKVRRDILIDVPADFILALR